MLLISLQTACFQNPDQQVTASHKCFFLHFKLRYLKTSPKKAQIEGFVRSRPLGDFFVLYQLGKNLNRCFFVEFVTRLSDLEEREGASVKEDGDEGDTILDMFLKPHFDESDTLKKD